MTYLAVLTDICSQVADPELDTYKERAKDHFLRALAGMVKSGDYTENDLKGYIKLKDDLVFTTNPYSVADLNIADLISVMPNPLLPNNFSVTLKTFEELALMSHLTELQPQATEVIIYKIGYNLYAVYRKMPGAESLKETDFATHEKWAVTGNFDDTGGNAAFVWSAWQTSTLTQTDLLIAGVGSKWYKFTYTIDETVPFDGDGVATITTDFALVAKKLNLNPGTHTVYFKSKVAPGDFVISIVSGSDSEGTFSFDDFSLNRMIDGSNFNPDSDELYMKYVEDIDGTAWGDSTDLTATPIFFSDSFIRRGIDIAAVTLLNEVKL